LHALPPLPSAQIFANEGYLQNPVGLNLIATGTGPGNGNLLTANGGAGTLVEIAPNTAAVPGLQVRVGTEGCGSFAVERGLYGSGL
jgi:hypothetical protein